MTNNRKVPEPLSDITNQSWVDRWFPMAWVPFAKAMRLDRPIGIWLLLIPGLWSIVMAARLQDMPHLVFIFTMGAIVMRAAGCIYNDLIDIDIDRMVVRTRSRPIASGEISPRNAIILLVSLLVFALALLTQLPRVAVFLGFFALIPVAIYPVLKRFTYWPQVMLGIAFNWGTLMGWAASHVHLSTSAFMLYGAGLSWTMIYDTIYAHQDKEDDLLIGVKSTALKFGNATPYVLLAFAVVMFLFLYVVGFREELSGYYFIGIFAAFAGIAHQTFNLDYDNPAACLRAFKLQAYAGWIVLLSIAFGRYT
jgi:4-hydroxybenzoate polyprenyltransferase